MKQGKSQVNTQTVGRIGEVLAARYLSDRGCTILHQNYRVPFAEIDIIAEKQQTVYFCEVKTVSYETRHELEESFSRETWRPEEMIHAQKIRQVEKGAEAWLQQSGYTGSIKLIGLAVRIVPRETFSTVTVIPFS